MSNASKGIILGLACALVILPGRSGLGEEPKVNNLMKRKLEESQKILEGIALADFDKITKHADELSTISRHVQWKVLKTPLYALYSDEFQRSSDRLSRNARDKNLDAAALTYVELTLTCVKCHKHVREVRMARLDRD